MAEKAILEDVLRAGEVLVLRDGRRLAIAQRADATAASIWFPGARLTLKERRGQLVVSNDETGEAVSAKWASGRQR